MILSGPRRKIEEVWKIYNLLSSSQDSELSKITSFDNDVPVQALIATIGEISKVSEISSITA